MNKTQEVSLATILGVMFIVILQGHKMHKEGRLPPVLAKVFSAGQATETAVENTEADAKTTKEAGNTTPAMALPTYAMVNRAVMLKDIESGADLGTLKQGIVVYVTSQKESDFTIEVGDTQGILPYDALTFRK